MIYIEGDRLLIKFPELHPNAGLEINFQRTLRLPDDGKEHHLPPGFGSFPLRHIEAYNLGERSSLKARGGVIMPMFQADALWMNFSPLVEDYDSVVIQTVCHQNSAVRKEGYILWAAEMRFVVTGYQFFTVSGQ